ncbi:Mut7-C RNAse domain-containing protein [Candidatus Bathyarchaeota archaeon]|nr:Mut7-C RNAse domain-containing protein [Candidatus Bathyarchaeota archaeon]
MKFVADGMLGKLTRWLRMLGYDVKYSNDFDDAHLLSLVKKEKRILLTRDFELYRQTIAKGFEAFYVERQTKEDTLALLAERFDIKLGIDMANSRCPKCNTKIKPIPKEDVKDNIEQNTLMHYNDFWICPKCKQIYWQGSHWTKIRKSLKMAKETFQNLQRSERHNT